LFFFIGSFFAWISVDFGTNLGVDVSGVCEGFSDPELRATCEQGVGTAPTSPTTLSTNAWDLVLTSAAAVIMALIVIITAAVGLRLLRANRNLRSALVAGVLVTDIIVLNFFANYDFSLLGSALFEEGFGALGEVGPGALSPLSLGFGFWIAIVGLPSLAVTLAGLIGYRGVARLLIEDRSVGGFPAWFENLGQQPIVGPFLWP